LREINREAGQRNATALQYHFGDRNGLVRAVIAKHRADTDPRRQALLDQYEARGVDDLHALAVALVLPLSAKLADPDGGRAFLQINCEVYSQPELRAERVPPRDPSNSIWRWHALLDPLMAADEREILHTRFPALRFAFVELGRRAADAPRRDDRLFTSHLIDLVTALLSSQPSDATRRLLEQRRTGPEE
jgi:AcrR family transcriptional regulator